MPVQPTNEFLEGLYQKLKGRAAGMADLVGPGVDTEKLSDDEISALWNLRAVPIEKEWEMWRQGRTPETAHLPTMTREEIGLAVYPNREKLAKSGGRSEPKDFIPWMNKRAEKEAAKRAAQQPAPFPDAPIISTVDGR